MTHPASPLSQDDEWTGLERLARAATPGKRLRQDHAIVTAPEDGGRILLYPRASADCPREDGYYQCYNIKATADLYLKANDSDFIIACSPDTITRLIAAARATTPASITAEAGPSLDTWSELANELAKLDDFCGNPYTPQNIARALLAKFNIVRKP